jgi:uracil-DNA glycosylase family 4
MTDVTALTIGEINRELAARARACNLNYDCGCDGIYNAEIAIISDYPGEREKTNKMPLSGGAGSFLWDKLRRYNITRRQVYVTNVCKRQVLRDHKGNENINKHELDHWEGILQWELAQLPNLRYVLLAGSYALRALAGCDGIVNWRGSVFDIRLNNGRIVKAVVCFNPAYVMREPKWETMFAFDLNKLNMVVQGKWEPYAVKAFINPSYNGALDWIKRMRSSAKQGLPISFDIETINNETACVGLADHDHEGMCINFRDRGTNRFELHEEKAIRLALQELLTQPGIKLVAQNGNFDSHWLWFKDRIKAAPLWFDTLLAHHLLYPSLPHNLGFLTAQYTTHPYYKDEGKNWKEGGNIDEYWEYNVKDCCITRKCSHALLEELRRDKLDTFFFDHVMRLQPELVRMTVHGVKCDVPLKQKIAEAVAGDVEQLKQKFWTAVKTATGIEAYEPNPQSPKQMAELFFKKLNLIGRGTSTDKLNRDKMIAHPRTTPAAREVLVSLNKLAVEQKFFSTYADSTIDEDGRFRCEYKQYGVAAAPGRLSSAATLWGSGGNLQNQPPRAQEMFIADAGYEFTYFDMAQIEARIVGWLAPVPKWKEQFERARLEPGSYDAHCALASDMFNIPYNAVPKEDFDADGNKTVRFTAKRCRHGLNYRMGPDRLADTAGMTIEEAHRNYKLYHMVNPEIAQWWENTIETVKRDKKLVTPYGRIWRLMERINEDTFDSIIAFVPQSTAGDHVAGVIHLAHNDPEWPRLRDGRLQARVVLNIHDALITLNRASEREVCAHILKKYAERPIWIRGEPLIVPADFKVSQPDANGIHRWTTLKKYKIAA